MPIANYTTDVPVSRTVGQIMGMLASAGASAITQHISEDGVTASVSFVIREAGQGYRLPVRIDGVLGVLRADRVAPRYQTREHAAKVAWRIAHDWLRSQLALIEAQMVTLPEVMFPYALVDPHTTAFEAFQMRELER